MEEANENQAQQVLEDEEGLQAEETEHDPFTASFNALEIRENTHDDRLFKKPLPIGYHRNYVASVHRRRKRQQQKNVRGSRSRRRNQKLIDLPYCLKSLLLISDLAQNHPFTKELMRGGLVCTLAPYRLNVPIVFLEHFQSYADHEQQKIDRFIEENDGDDVEIEDDPVLDIECMRFFKPDDEDEDEEEEDEEEEEDVDSDGECDEEVQKVVDDLLMKEKARLEKMTLQEAEVQKPIEEPVVEQSAKEQPATEQIATASIPTVAGPPTAPPPQQRAQIPPPVRVEIVNYHYRSQLWMKCPRRPNILPPNVRVVDVRDPNADKDKLSIAKDVIRALELSPGKNFVTAFNENFVLGICYSRNPVEKSFCRFHPRNFLYDPPVHMEFILNERFVSEEEKRRFVAQTKDKYPGVQDFSYADLRYLEDPYWFQQRPIPDCIQRPPQPIDFEERMRRAPSVKTLYTMVMGDDTNFHDFMNDCIHAMVLQDREGSVPIGFDLSSLPF